MLHNCSIFTYSMLAAFLMYLKSSLAGSILWRRRAGGGGRPAGRSRAPPAGRTRVVLALSVAIDLAPAAAVCAMWGFLIGASALLRLPASHTLASPPPPTTAQGLPCVSFQPDVASCGTNCTRHVLNDTIATHGAGCLDGSAPGFYFRPGRGTGAQKYLLWSHGGGWCRTEGECAGRALTYEGSSRCNPERGPPRANMDSGIMSSNCAENPRFCNHTVVYFMYCDGGSWTGDRDEPVPTSQAEYADPPVPSVHLKGRRNLEAILDTLLTPDFGLAAASEVLYAGASAGGLTSYVRKRSPSSVSQSTVAIHFIDVDRCIKEGACR